MKYEFFGQESRQVSGSIKHEVGVDAPLAACPFCRARDDELEVVNTWTPAYHVECTSCGAQGPTAYRAGRAHWATEKSARSAHREVFQRAINLWNERP